MIDARRRQSGAVAVFAAVTLLAAIVAIALAIDIGRLYYAQRDLQRLANVAAMDSARISSECIGAVSDRQNAATAEVARSLRTNGGKLEYMGPNAVSLGAMRTSGDLVRYFEPTSAYESYAVQVSLRAPAPGRLVPGITGDSNYTMIATAAAASSPIATFWPTSEAIGVRPPGLPDAVSGMLGVDAGLVSSEGLFTSSVRLGDLAAEVGAGSVEEFLRTEISAVDFLDGLARLLSGTTNTAVRQSVETMADGADAGRTFVPGDVIFVPDGFEQPAQDAVVNVGAAVTGAAQYANGQEFLHLEIPIGTLPFTSPGNVSVRVIEGPRTASGPPGRGPDGEPMTAAQTSQVAAEISLPISLAGIGSNLKFFVHGAEASASLEDLKCPRRGLEQPEVTIRARSNIVRVGIGEFEDMNSPEAGTRPVALLTIPTPLFTVTISAYSEVPMGTSSDELLQFVGPFDPENPQSQAFGPPPGEALAAAIDGLTTNLVFTVDPPSALNNPLVSATVQSVLDNLRPAINSASKGLADPLLEPLMKSLGITVGGSQVYVASVDAGPPVLFLR